MSPLRHLFTVSLSIPPEKLLALACGRGSKRLLRVVDLRSGTDAIARDLDSALTAADTTPDGQFVAAGWLPGTGRIVTD